MYTILGIIIMSIKTTVFDLLYAIHVFHGTIPISSYSVHLEY